MSIPKKTPIFFLVQYITILSFATEQVPDKLLYKDLKLALNTGWGHPSPLQTYFYQNQMPYPFTMLSTANYRGHIATWVIQNDRFYLKEINVKENNYSPDKYAIKPKTNSAGIANLVFADWFSGVIECYKRDEKGDWNARSTFYFHIRNGEILSAGEITEKDIEKINKLSFKDTADRDLMAKYKLLILNQNYITYYYRLNENDVIEYNNKNCQLNTNVSRPGPIYSLYSNQHLNWPYNWENLEKCGAPHCKWKVVNDSLILTSVELYSGLSFDSINKENIELSSLLAKDNNRQVFADWVTGIQLIIFGIDTTYGFGLKQFKPKEYTYCRIEKGIIKEAYTIPSDFDMEKNEAKLDQRLRDLMKEY